ncbi:MAG: rod shape-determining protein RodA [Deltaproteobacteria bacterium]|nr:rod shape-determining protein RodA [Deltaproteobacteria bacterium]MCW5805195.1 rod shape-determining protein RodA [Deltaproteobacteria bacterium]
MRGTGLALPRSTIGVSRWRRFRAAVDWPLIITVVALCAIGLLNLHSSTVGTRHHARCDTQMRWMIVGTIAFVVVTVIDYRALVRLAILGLVAAIVLLIVVRLLGEGAHGKGSYRWLNMGSGQPSELAKLIVILALARMFQDGEPTRYTPEVLVAWGVALAIPVGLIAIQPDLGTATLLSLIILTVGFLAMPSVWPMVHVTLAGLLAIPILWEKMEGYQKDRILGFLDPNPQGNGWQTWQSVFAVGSGRVWGKGMGESTQKEFVPEYWTDFPFAIWSEEWGFVGSFFLLAIFGFLIVWILNVGLSARDRVGAVICVGVAGMTFWHVLVNIAMVLGIAPVVGVTLPFISYGGSSLIVFFMAMGLVANVSLRKHGY